MISQRGKVTQSKGKFSLPFPVGLELYIEVREEYATIRRY